MVNLTIVSQLADMIINQDVDYVTLSDIKEDCVSITVVEILAKKTLPMHMT